MERWSRLCWLGLALLAAVSHAFAPFPRSTSPLSSVATIRPSTKLAFQLKDEETRPSKSRLVKIIDRFDTLKSAGYVNSGPSSRRPLVMRGPGFKRIAFWLFVGFMYKWYRARFINKVRTVEITCLCTTTFCLVVRTTQQLFDSLLVDAFLRFQFGIDNPNGTWWLLIVNKKRN